jgi:hypothetical protein
MSGSEAVNKVRGCHAAYDGFAAVLSAASFFAACCAVAVAVSTFEDGRSALRSVCGSDAYLSMLGNGSGPRCAHGTDGRDRVDGASGSDGDGFDFGRARFDHGARGRGDRGHHCSGRPARESVQRLRADMRRGVEYREPGRHDLDADAQYLHGVAGALSIDADGLRQSVQFDVASTRERVQLPESWLCRPGLHLESPARRVPMAGLAGWLVAGERSMDLDALGRGRVGYGVLELVCRVPRSRGERSDGRARSLTGRECGELGFVDDYKFVAGESGDGGNRRNSAFVARAAGAAPHCSAVFSLIDLRRRCSQAAQENTRGARSLVAEFDRASARLFERVTYTQHAFPAVPGGLRPANPIGLGLEASRQLQQAEVAALLAFKIGTGWEAPMLQCPARACARRLNDLRVGAGNPAGGERLGP